MRLRLRQAMAGMTAALVLAGAGACAEDTGAHAQPSAPAPSPSAADRDAEIYVQVIRRYISTPNDNSFPGRTFAKVFVLDVTVPTPGYPMADPVTGAPIAPGTQQLITGALSDIGPVTFVADRHEAYINDSQCAEVKDGGILITLGPANGPGDRVEVGVHGFVACQGATSLTYVVEHATGTGWQVTGTTGSRTIS